METMTQARRNVLEKAIATSIVWTMEKDRPDGMARFGIMDMNSLNKGVIEDCIFTADELDQIDNRLSAVFKELVTEHGLPGTRARCAINYFLCRPVKLPARVKKVFQMHHRDVYKLHSIEVVPATQSVRLFVDDYDVVETACGVKYAYHFHDVKIEVPFSWMDATYPEWHKRYNIAFGLGISLSELIDFTTQPEARVASVAMVDVSFQHE